MITTIIISENSNDKYAHTTYLKNKNKGVLEFALYDSSRHHDIENVQFNYNISNDHIIITYVSKHNDFNENISKSRHDREHIYKSRQQEIEYTERKILELKYELDKEFDQNITTNILLSNREYEIRTELNHLYAIKAKHIDEINLLSKTPICFKYVETQIKMETKVKFNEWSNPICIFVDRGYYGKSNNYDIIFNYTENIPDKSNRVKEITKKTEMNFLENDDDDDDDFDNLIL